MAKRGWFANMCKAVVTILIAACFFVLLSPPAFVEAKEDNSSVVPDICNHSCNNEIVFPDESQPESAPACPSPCHNTSFCGNTIDMSNTSNYYNPDISVKTYISYSNQLKNKHIVGAIFKPPKS